MNRDALKGLNASIVKLTQIRSSVAKALSEPANDGTCFDLSKAPPSADWNVAELDSALGFLLDGARALMNARTTPILPRNQIVSLSNSLHNIALELDSINLQLVNSGGIQSVTDAENYSFTSGSGNGLSLSSHFGNISGQLENAITSWAILRSIAGPKYKDLNESHRLLAERRIAFDNQFREAAQKNQQLTDIRARSAEYVQAIDEQRGEAERLVREAAKDRQTINEYSAEGAQKLEAIRSVSEQAAELESAVKAYDQTFREFQASLDNRNHAIASSSNEMEALLEHLEAQRVEIDRLTQKADDMLVGATNAGLAATFSERERKLDNDVSTARRSFYFSILILMISSVPIITYILPKELIYSLMDIIGTSKRFGGEQAQSGHNVPEIIGQVLARALLLIPGAWLVRFAASRHERLFRLREHYQYKYSIATSVEGFKRQASGYEDEIAAATFFELTFNPANSMDTRSPEARHPNKLMEALLERLDGKLAERARIIADKHIKAE